MNATSSSVTVSTRSLMGTGLVLVALVVAYLLGNSGGGAQAAPVAAQSPQAAAPAAGGERRSLTMEGVGRATAVPDQLSFALGVSLTRPDLDTALTDSSRTMKRVLAALAPYGVERGDVQTTGLSMDPVYDYHQYSPPTIRGYHVSQRAAVLVDELRQGGAAIGAAVAAGGNSVRVSDIRLKVGDPEAALKRAREAAVAQATAKAEQYAAAAGEELAGVVTLREVSAPRQDVLEGWRAQAGYLGRDMATMKGALPIRTGRDELEVRVQVVWEFA